jgi:hypothetical protein
MRTLARLFSALCERERELMLQNIYECAKRASDVQLISDNGVKQSSAMQIASFELAE